MPSEQPELSGQKPIEMRPDSRWRAELLGLYQSAESCQAEITDKANVEYQAGVMAACAAIWFRVTGKSLGDNRL